MNAHAYLRSFDHLPADWNGNKPVKASNNAIRRWLETGAVVINGKQPKPNDEISFPIWQLIFFPKNRKKRCTMFDIPQNLRYKYTDMEFNLDDETVTPPLAPNTKVISNNQPDMKLAGEIAGIAQPRVPGYGFLYVLKLDDESKAKVAASAGAYAYDCICVPEIDLELAN